MEDKKRCDWCLKEDIYKNYHDTEWGRPNHDDRHLFEMICLEGAQAGLSWITILKKRENYRKAFDNWDARLIANYNDAKVEALMQDAGIVRNRLKITSCVDNARGFLKIVDEFGSFNNYIWQFVNHTPIKNKVTTLREIPITSPQSDAMSKDLKRRGFRFVGSTICYSFMQAVGMVNDHLVDCWCYDDII